MISELKNQLIEEVTKGKKNLALSVIKTYLFGSASKRSILLYRFGKFFHKTGYNIISKIIFQKIQKQYGIYISPNAEIAIGLKLPHPVGIVIGDGVVIGKNSTIFQNVTLGGSVIGDAKKGAYPRIGENTVIFAGAILIGNINIGNFCTIGANSVVNKSFPDNKVIAGIPAKIINNRSLEAALEHSSSLEQH